MSDTAIYQPTPQGTGSENRINRADENSPECQTMDANSESQERHAQILTGAGLLFATVVVLGLWGVLVVFAMLRENQVFWTNAGGYPIWLRDLVLWTFFPLLGMAGLSLLALSMVCFSRVCRSLQFFVVEALLLLVCWGLFASTFYIAFSNNLINIIEGRDVHTHSQGSPGL